MLTVHQTLSQCYSSAVHGFWYPRRQRPLRLEAGRCHPLKVFCTDENRLLKWRYRSYRSIFGHIMCACSIGAMTTDATHTMIAVTFLHPFQFGQHTTIHVSLRWMLPDRHCAAIALVFFFFSISASWVVFCIRDGRKRAYATYERRGKKNFSEKEEDEKKRVEKWTHKGDLLYDLLSW